MSDHNQQLIRLVREQTGENFRSAFAYDADEWHALYVRPDLATDDLESIVPSLADRARAQEPLVRERDYPKLGTVRASISLHENAVLIHFHQGDRSGIVVTLETDVARNLSEFVARCEKVLAE